MDLWEAIMIAFRRWYVVIPVLVGGLLLGQYVADSVEPVYRADATIQYRPPAVDQTDEEAVVAVASNPWVNLSTLITATEVASQDDVLAIDLAAQGYGRVAFAISSDRRSPLMTVQTESTSPNDTIGALEFLVEYVQRDAIDRQTLSIGDQPDYFVELDVLQQDVVPSTDLTSRTRTRVLMGAVAVALAVAAAVAVEALVRLVRRRREGDEAEGDGDGAPDVVWFGLPVSGGQAVQPPPQQLTAISGGSDWREQAINDAATGDPDAEELRPTGSEKRRTRWAR